MKRKILALLLVVILVLPLFVACSNTSADKTDENISMEENSSESEKTYSQREQTLFITGKAWGSPSGFNHMAGWASFPVDSGDVPLVYEPLFLYNYKTNKLEPLIAKSYSWDDDYTITVKLHDFVKFRDGEDLTAEDVKYTFELGKDYWPSWGGVWTNLDSIDLVNDYTLKFNLKRDDFHNKLAIKESLTNVPIHPKHIWVEKEKEVDYDSGKLAEIFNEDPIGSGPYKIKQYDETRIVLERDDNYWGQELFGGLPKPKYIVHALFEGNEGASLALTDNKLDYSEDFHANVSNIMDKSNVKTFLSEKPFYPNDTIPSLYINLNKDGLKNKKVRQALAYAINYNEISEKAMSGYSSEMKASLMTKNPNEQALLNDDELKDLRWNYNIEKANEVLDSIGAKKGDDGIRVLPDGTRLGPWKLVCPNGWTDWNATLEIVAQSAKDAGIELVTEFPEWGVYDEKRATGEYDFIMSTPAAYISPANPWKRVHDLMSSVGVPEIGERAYWNWSRFKDERADELIKKIPNIDDKDELKKLYTELDGIYLDTIPSIPLMYRPTWFYTVNETYWTGFPTGNDEIPAYLFNGSGYKALYELEHTK